MGDNITLIISVSNYYASYTVNNSINSSSSASSESTTNKKWRDIIDPELLNYIPDLWLNYEPPSRYQHYLFGITYLLILFPAIFGNSAIIWLFYRCRNLRTPSNIFVVNLALSDLIQNLKMPVFIYNSFKCGPAMGELGCQIYGFFGGLSGTSAIMTIAMMAIERLNSISSPLNPYSRLSMRRAIVISGLIWLYSFIFSTPPVFHIFNRYVPEGYLTSCSFDYLSTELVSRLFIIAFFTAAWVVPFILITLSYTGIIFAVRRNENAFRATQNMINDKSGNLYRASQRSRHQKNGVNMETRLVKVVLCLILLWLISWTPYAVVALLGLVDQRYISPTSSMIPALFAKTSSVVNPYLYGLTNPRFKRELRRKIAVFCWRPKTPSNTLGTIIKSTAEESHFVRISDENLSAINLSDYEMKELTK